MTTVGGLDVGESAYSNVARKTPWADSEQDGIGALVSSHLQGAMHRSSVALNLLVTTLTIHRKKEETDE